LLISSKTFTKCLNLKPTPYVIVWAVSPSIMTSCLTSFISKY